VKILAGMHYNDLHEVARVEWQQPSGWMSIPLYDDGSSAIEEGERSFLKTFMLQIMIVGNQQMGKDSHVRLIHVYSPRE
jgi:anaphase-promoting complex subunit 10